jgi:hypothetical protein
MHWGWIGSTTTVASAVAAFLAYLGSVPFSPARFWSWRLRTHMQTVNSLDDGRHKAQKEVLLRRADYLADKAAAAHQIPTPWWQYVIGSAIWVYFAAAFANAAWEHYHLGIRVYPIFWVTASYACVLAFPPAYRFTVVYLRHTARERARFIAEGCPADFVTSPPMYFRQRFSRASANFRSATSERANRLIARVASAQSRWRR